MHCCRAPAACKRAVICQRVKLSGKRLPFRSAPRVLHDQQGLCGFPVIRKELNRTNSWKASRNQGPIPEPREKLRFFLLNGSSYLRDNLVVSTSVMYSPGHSSLVIGQHTSASVVTVLYSPSGGVLGFVPSCMKHAGSSGSSPWLRFTGCLASCITQLVTATRTAARNVGARLFWSRPEQDAVARQEQISHASHNPQSLCPVRKTLACAWACALPKAIARCSTLCLPACQADPALKQLHVPWPWAIGWTSLGATSGASKARSRVLARSFALKPFPTAENRAASSANHGQRSGKIKFQHRKTRQL